MRKNKNIKRLDPNKIDDWKGFLEEFQKETDRGAAIVGAAFLDVLLEQLISNFLIDDKEKVNELLNPDYIYAPLSSFSAKRKASYCLGLISLEEHADLKTINDVRNLFAHNLHGLSFNENEIVKLCDTLHVPNKLSLLDISQTARFRFITTVSILSQQLKIRSFQAEKQKRPIIKGFTVYKVKKK